MRAERSGSCPCLRSFGGFAKTPCDEAQHKGLADKGNVGGRRVAALKWCHRETTNQSIQSFKSLRNAALHAQWTEVSVESLKLLLVFLPVFIEKHGL